MAKLVRGPVTERKPGRNPEQEQKRYVLMILHLLSLSLSC